MALRKIYFSPQKPSITLEVRVETKLLPDIYFWITHKPKSEIWVFFCCPLLLVETEPESWGPKHGQEAWKGSEVPPASEMDYYS